MASAEFDDPPLYEIVDGRRVDLPMSLGAARLTCRLALRVSSYLNEHDLGEMVLHLLFRLPLKKEVCRRPKLALVSYQRWPKHRRGSATADAWDVVPDLAAEVISPNDLAEDLLEKIEEYFQAGVRLVWVVYPQRQIVHVYESLTVIRGLTRTDELDGGVVLPGFRLLLSALFPEEPVAG